MEIVVTILIYADIDVLRAAVCEITRFLSSSSVFAPTAGAG